jgi:hypothetical protein
MADSYKIINPSQKVLQEAVKTVPAEPRYIGISLIADGILEPKTEESPARYLNECFRHNIIPSSSIVFKYDSYFNSQLDSYRAMFLLSHWGDSVASIGAGHSDEHNDAIQKALLKGGRFYRIKTKIETEGGFKAFKESFLDDLVKNGYQIDDMDLWLDYYHSTQHYEEGDVRTGGLNYHSWQKQLVLDFSFDMSKEAENSLTKWFTELKNVDSGNIK